MDAEDVRREGLTCLVIRFSLRSCPEKRDVECSLEGWWSERISPAECRATANAAQEGKVCFREIIATRSPARMGVIATLRLVNLKVIFPGPNGIHVDIVMIATVYLHVQTC